MNTISINATADDAAQFKGHAVRALLTDGSELTGNLISINSKGWNFDVDGTVVSRSLSRVEAVTVTVNNADDLTEATSEIDDEDDQDESAEDTMELGDTDEMDELEGMTTAELAAMFHTTAKELRVTLRALGMGVGKGRQYHLTSDQVKTVKAELAG